MDDRYYRQSLPTREQIIAGAACLLAADLLMLMLMIPVIGSEFVDVQLLHLILRPLLAYLAITTAVLPFVLAISRLVRFPDRSSAGYAQWLAQTPWTSHQRTPFGPWHPVKEDVPMLIGLSVLAMLRASPLLLLPNAADAIPLNAWQIVILLGLSQPVMFVLSWAVIGFLIVCRRWDWSVYSALMLSGGVAHLFYFLPVAAFVVSAILLIGLPIVVYRRMKLELSELQHELLREPASEPPERSSVFELLSPHGHHTAASLFQQEYQPRAFTIGLVLLVCLTTVPGRFFAFMLAPFVAFFPLFQVASFGSTYRSHLGLRARYRLKRWCVPEYDRIWLPVLWSALVSVAILLLEWSGSLPPGTSPVLATSAIVTVCLFCSPRFSNWSLTAPVSISVKNQPQSRSIFVK